MTGKRKVGNLLALALLALLVPGRPMHPYQMAGILRRTGKERDMRIKWGSLYTVVANLDKHGFIQTTGSLRAGNRPERTLYTITESGRAELRDWMHDLIARPEPEFPRFAAALSVIAVLPPDEVTALLGQRLAAVRREIGELRELIEISAQIPRIFLIEAEYALAMQQAEEAWVSALLAELTAGTLPGLAEWRHVHEHGFTDDVWGELLQED